MAKEFLRHCGAMRSRWQLSARMVTGDIRCGNKTGQSYLRRMSYFVLTPYSPPAGRAILLATIRLPGGSHKRDGGQPAVLAKVVLFYKPSIVGRRAEEQRPRLAQLSAAFVAFQVEHIGLHERCLAAR